MGLALGGCRGERGGAASLAIPGEPGPRVTVEVLNPGAQAGLAKTATRLLRRAGIDVLAFGNAPGALGPRDSTRVLVWRGTAALGQRVHRALGVGRVVVTPDSTKLLDATVLLGVDFAPTRLEFHP